MKNKLRLLLNKNKSVCVSVSMCINSLFVDTLLTHWHLALPWRLWFRKDSLCFYCWQNI